MADYSENTSSDEDFSAISDESTGEDNELVGGRDDLKVVAPYSYEPRRVRPPTARKKACNQDRVGKNDWCQCGQCDGNADLQSLFCCRESPQLQTKRQMPQPNPNCITEHRGFQLNCLEPEVLIAVYNHYRCQYGHMHVDQAKRYRYTAYRNLVFWAWGSLGRHNRVPLPSCVVKAIRANFPDEQQRYTGFAYPAIG